MLGWGTRPDQAMAGYGYNEMSWLMAANSSDTTPLPIAFAAGLNVNREIIQPIRAVSAGLDGLRIYRFRPHPARRLYGPYHDGSVSDRAGSAMN